MKHFYTRLMPALAGLLIALAGGFATPATAGSCSASDDYYVLDAGANAVLGTEVPVGFPAGFSAMSMVMTTVPDYEQWGFSFVAQGDQIHMLYDGTGSGKGDIEDDSLITFDLGDDSNLTGTIVLYDLSSADPIELADGSYQYTLYAVGLYADGAGQTKPYFFVLDQVAMLDRFEIQNSSDPSLYTAPPYILTHNDLCHGPDCSGIAGEVQVYTPTGDPKQQYAYVQGLGFNPMPTEQQIMKIQRSGDTSWNVSVAYSMEPAGPFAFPHLGLAFDDSTETPYGAYGRKILNLETGVASCLMGGTVTDVSIWSLPGSFGAFTHTSYTFATVQGTTTSKLVGFPTGECPDTNKDSTIERTVGHAAIKSLMYRESLDSPFTVHVLSSNNTVKTFDLDIEPGNLTSEDKINVLGTSTHSLGSGVIDISAKPINLGCCERIGTLHKGDDTWEGCSDQCWVPEDGERTCFLGNSTDAQPPRCLDPDDIACRTGVGGKHP